MHRSIPGNALAGILGSIHCVYLEASSELSLKHIVKQAGSMPSSTWKHT